MIISWRGFVSWDSSSFLYLIPFSGSSSQWNANLHQQLLIYFLICSSFNFFSWLNHWWDGDQKFFETILMFLSTLGNISMAAGHNPAHFWDRGCVFRTFAWHILGHQLYGWRRTCQANLLVSVAINTSLVLQLSSVPVSSLALRTGVSPMLMVRTFTLQDCLHSHQSSWTCMPAS
jgi:hypothetical protein